MAYVPVPKDLAAVKTKVLFNLTKRQLICFGSGALIGVPVFFLLKSRVGSSTSAICMIIVMLPFFLLAMYEKNGQPLEKILRNIIEVSFIRLVLSIIVDTISQKIYKPASIYYSTYSLR